MSGLPRTIPPDAGFRRASSHWKRVTSLIPSVYTIMSVSNGYAMWHNIDAGIYAADPSVTFMTRANADPAKNPRFFIAYGFEYQLPPYTNDVTDPLGEQLFFAD